MAGKSPKRPHNPPGSPPFTTGEAATGAEFAPARLRGIAKPRPSSQPMNADRLQQICGRRVVVIGFAVTAALIASCSRPVDSPLLQQAYVWQRVWTPAVSEAIEQASPYISGWHVLFAETHAQGDWQQFLPDVVTKKRGPDASTVVVRIDGQRTLADQDALIRHIDKLVDDRGIRRWTSLEIDYDCPTHQLPIYVQFLHALKLALPRDVVLSITALPTWIASPVLGDLLSAADESVLQVHSVLDPRRGLFDAQAALLWITSYSKRADKPFSVALPDYGSRVGWDTRGKLVSVVSEQDGVQSASEQQELEASPQDVARLLSGLRASHPRNLKGIVWFRLPVSGDQRIWSPPTFEAVIRGWPLVAKRTVRVDRDALGAYRIVLQNVGLVDTMLPSAMHLAPCAAADGLGDYSVAHDSKRLTFARRGSSMLRVGQRAEIGWTRCAVLQEDLSIED